MVCGPCVLMMRSNLLNFFFFRAFIFLVLSRLGWKITPSLWMYHTKSESWKKNARTRGYDGTSMCSRHVSCYFLVTEKLSSWSQRYMIVRAAVVSRKILGASLVSGSSTRPPLNDGGRLASKASTQPKHLVSTLPSNHQVSLVLSANIYHIIMSQLLSRGTTPIPGELFCWDFFEMYYKMTGSSAKLDQWNTSFVGIFVGTNAGYWR